MISGERIKKARLAKGLSQLELANLMNVTDATICNYERGTRKASIDKLLVIAENLDVSLDYLVGQDKIVVSESKDYTVKMSNEEIAFIKEIRKYNDVYRLINDDPKRTALLISKKVG
ncbi:MAG: helix-turn-helix domain-containing protein [Erysipelotrichaceae bacterium]|nr:helix-turn-helix domain-containing protein [Erysipelotrichaceae bacterium]